ncbi:MAG: helix-turn-helix transcriptional regulator [Chloroflexi bacterium]|nr:helix-turn-helix transcriptional regulator [Chloroflexota bacterium]
MEPTATRRKPRVLNVVDNRPLAKAIGENVRRLRTAAKLTQRELAQPRYTPAYVSALENALTKPSMAALHYFGERLGVPIGAFLPAEPGRADRLGADLRLASGDYAGALGEYQSLLDSAVPDRARAEILRGIAESLCRLRRGAEAVAPAAESAARFERLQRAADAAYAGYWLAYAHYLADNSGEARTILKTLLERVREGMEVLPDFRFRLLVALANVENWEGEPQRALAYLEEARGRVSDLDDGRRATLLMNLSRSYGDVGDDEASLQAGSQALVLFQVLHARQEIASMENTLSLAMLHLGHLERAHAFAAQAREHADVMPEATFLPHVLDTEAQIALAEGNHEAALQKLAEAAADADGGRNPEASAAIHYTRARVLAAEGRPDHALDEFRLAAQGYRDLRFAGRLRPLLSEWAELLDRLGKPAEAVVLYREAMALKSRG